MQNFGRVECNSHNRILRQIFSYYFHTPIGNRPSVQKVCWVGLTQQGAHPGSYQREIMYLHIILNITYEILLKVGSQVYRMLNAKYHGWTVMSCM